MYQTGRQHYITKKFCDNPIFCMKCPYIRLIIRPKKKISYVVLKWKNLKIGSVGRILFFFYFHFLRRAYISRAKSGSAQTAAPDFKVYFHRSFEWAKRGQNAVKMHKKVMFLSHWTRILGSSSHNLLPKNCEFVYLGSAKKKRKKSRPCIFAFYGRSLEDNIRIFFFRPKWVPGGNEMSAPVVAAKSWSSPIGSGQVSDRLTSIQWPG